MATGSLTSITDLNEYCILQMVSHLSPKDKLSLISACDSFGYLCSEIDLTLLNACFGISESKRILSLCGPYIQKLNHIGNAPVSEPIYEILYQVTRSCPNVQELDIALIGYHNHPSTEVSHKYFYHFRDLISPLEQLQVLRLDDCGLSDINCEIISNLSNLKRLDLSLNGMITGKYLPKLKNLTFLNLTNCTKFESEHFIAICASSKLKMLSIIGCSELNNTAIEALVESQTDLEMILTSRIDNTDITKICQLKNLKIIQIVGPEYIRSLTQPIQCERDFLDSLNFMVHEDDNDILEQTCEQISHVRKLKSANLNEVHSFSGHLEEFVDMRSKGIAPNIPNFVKNYVALPSIEYPNDDDDFSVGEAMLEGLIVGVMEKNTPLEINEVEEFQRLFWEGYVSFQTEVYEHFFKYVMTLSFDDCSYTYYHNDYLSTYVYNDSDYIVIMKKLANFQDMDVNIADIIKARLLHRAVQAIWDQHAAN